MERVTNPFPYILWHQIEFMSTAFAPQQPARPVAFTTPCPALRCRSVYNCGSFSATLATSPSSQRPAGSALSFQTSAKNLRDASPFPAGWPDTPMDFPLRPKLTAWATTPAFRAGRSVSISGSFSATLATSPSSQRPAGSALSFQTSAKNLRDASPFPAGWPCPPRPRRWPQRFPPFQGGSGGIPYPRKKLNFFIYT
jgi:hypothetical protein